MSIWIAVMPLRGAADLEVHVAEVVLVAQDVGQDRVLVALLDEAHRDARDRRLDRARRRPSATGVPPQTAAIDERPVGLECLADDADRVRESLLGSGIIRASARSASAPWPISRRPGPRMRLGLAGRERREVVVEHEALPASRPSGASIFCSSLDVPSVVVTMAWVSPRWKSARPVHARQEAGFARDRADRCRCRDRRCGDSSSST